MNAKTCKKLRKQARELTKGMPERVWLQNRRTGAIIIGPSTRGLYKKLKPAERVKREAAK